MTLPRVPHRGRSLGNRPRCALLAVLASATGCADHSHAAPDAGPAASASALAASSASATVAPAVASTPPPPPPLRCPRGMMRVAAAAGPFCIDRWEASLVDKATGTPLSPYYPPDRRLAAQLAEQWERDRLTIGNDAAHAVPVPELPAWQREHDADPMAVSKQGVKPNGYLTSVVAARACANADKRLCKPDEWRTACEGEAKQPFPYGEKYVQGACNIFRSAHPGVVLHDNASTGHLDPRMNQVTDPSGEPLLRVTGATPRCKSEWEGDAAWDMNGNIDEWVDNSGAPVDAGGSKGLFLGGFYSRSKRDGCASAVGRHELTYLDYSTGTRCCWSPEPPGDAGAP